MALVRELMFEKDIADHNVESIIPALCIAKRGELVRARVIGPLPSSWDDNADVAAYRARIEQMTPAEIVVEARRVLAVRSEHEKTITKRWWVR